jgi:hypothetical protein
MSKNGFRKFKKNDYSYEDEELVDKPILNYQERKNQRRFERALKIKDLSALVDNDDEDPYYELDENVIQINKSDI